MSISAREAIRNGEPKRVIVDIVTTRPAGHE